MSTVLFAGGGTGGHVFPMIAVADAARALRSDLDIVFVGTERGLETKLVPERGYRLELVHVEPMRGGGPTQFFRGTTHAALAVFKARTLVKRLAPRAVFSIGGYAAGPIAVAAWTLGIPVALMEPNSAVGLANQLVTPFVKRAYTAFPESDAHFPANRVLRTGAPIRAGFRPAPYVRGETLRVLVLGGSQGAKALNDSVPRALAAAKTDVTVVHQCGAGKDAAVRELYEELGARDRARVIPFIDDVPTELAAADLVIGRAGAGAVAEICAVGRPSLLVPYPFAGDHQKDNAYSLERAGAAVCILSKDATPERLTEEIERLASDPARLPDMAAKAKALGRPDAARAIAADFLELAGLASSGTEGGRDGESGGDTPAHGLSPVASGGLPRV